ncbi:uncharacterized protein [Asterias amurensis]|uniref:uncharacterized protein n=1 Tax=Asterias amurensis TaxID=7602 RepID=UPI003AB53BC0
MSLFSGMKLASSGSNKPNQQTDSISTETVSSADSLIEGAENKNDSSKASDPSGFSFILGTDSRQSNTVDAICSSSAIELDESKSDGDTLQQLCKTPPQLARSSEPLADFCLDDDLNLELDPIKIDGHLKSKSSTASTVFDLQDVDFSLSAVLDSESSKQKDQDSVGDKSESSFSFITTGPLEHSNDSITPTDRSSTQKLCTLQSPGTTEIPESLKTQSLDIEEVTSTPKATRLRIHRELQKPHEARLYQIKKSIADVEEQVTQLSQDCVTLSHSLLQKRQQLQELQEKKQQAIDEEDYEKAEELHDKCQALEADTENLTSPLPCHHPALKTLLSDLLTLYAQEREEHQGIKDPYQELITKQQEAVTEAKEQCVQYENIHSRIVQGARSELERDLAHLQLDSEHLLKREEQLCTRIDEGTASLRQTRDALIEDRTQVQEEIKELEAKLRLLHLKETAITESITDNNQEIELVKREFSQEMQGIETEKEVLKENEIALRRRGERLEDEEREQEQKMLGVKEMESSETKLLADLQRNLALEELAIQELTSLESNLRNNLWPEESSTMLPERKEDLSMKNKAVREKMEEVQQATSMLLLSQTKVVTLRQRVSDTEGHIAALNETKQLAVAGKNFSEARRLTEEIKKLTSEGQLIQEEMEKLTQRNEETTKMVKLLREDVERIQEELDQDERQEETSVKEKMLNSIFDLRERLQVSTDSQLMQTLQRAQLMASAYHVRFLCLKHKLPLPAEVEELSVHPSTLDQF